MKTLLTFLIICWSVIGVKAQSTTPDSTANKIFYAVEKEAEFAGGMDNFYKFIGNNIHYPISAAKNKQQGKVFVAFVVEKDGTLTDVKISRGVSQDIDAEALRVINLSPKWKPGVQNGRPVREQYNIVVNFKLPEPEVIKEQLMLDSLRNVPFDQRVFSAVEHEPEFKGGIEAFYKYLQQTIHYPANASRNNVQGKVFLSFIVEKDGSLTNIRVARGVSEDIDAEALRVIKNSPNWIPGMQNGKPVRVAYMMPISFSLQSN